MKDGISTNELDYLTAETCAYMNLIHPHYSILAARIVVNNLHKETKDSFFETMQDLHCYVDTKSGANASLLADNVFQFIETHQAKIQQAIDYQRDYSYDFFGFKTLEKSYLLKLHNKIVERP